MDPAVPQLPSRVLFGAAYYNEYHQSDRLKVDLDLMRDAHFSVIRVGESVWSTWEPENGRFDLDWLQPVLDGAAERGISVIIGTPTYAIPPWLARQLPRDRRPRARPGSAIPWGARQEVDFTHPAFRFHAERVIRRIDRTVRRPPRGHRLPGGQRARAAAVAQPRRLPAVHRPPAPHATATSRR